MDCATLKQRLQPIFAQYPWATDLWTIDTHATEPACVVNMELYNAKRQGVHLSWYGHTEDNVWLVQWAIDIPSPKTTQQESDQPNATMPALMGSTVESLEACLASLPPLDGLAPALGDLLPLVRQVTEAWDSP